MAPDHPFLDLAERAAAVCGMAVEVTISGLQVAADIGVYAHEHGRTQPLVVDVILKIDAPARDALEETIDYQCVADDAHALALERTALIETYAMRLAERCIGYPGARWVEVRVSKPGALRGGLAGTRASLARAAADATPSSGLCERDRAGHDRHGDERQGTIVDRTDRTAGR